MSFQVTAVFEVPVTVAVNCSLVPTATWVLEGEMLMRIVGRIVTVAVLFLVKSAEDVAVTVTCAGLGTDPGAV